MLQAPTVPDGEENLNLVHPGSMHRGVNKGELSSVPLIEIGPSPIRAVMVDVQVIPNDDDALVVPVLLGDVLHQLEQVICRMGRSTACCNLAITDVKRCEQRLSAMSDIFVFISSRPARYSTFCGMLALDRLHTSLLINTKDHRVF